LYCRHRNPNDANSIRCLIELDPQGQGPHTIGPSSAHQPIGILDPVASSAVIEKSGSASGEIRENQRVGNQSLPAELSCGYSTIPETSTAPDCVRGLAKGSNAAELDFECAQAEQVDVAAAHAAAAGTMLPPSSGCALTAAPVRSSSSASKIPQPRIGDTVTPTAGLYTAGEGTRRIRSPESARRREVVEAAFMKKRASQKSALSSDDQETLQAEFSMSASPESQISSSLSRSGSPFEPRSTRIDRSQHGHSRSCSSIPSSPSRAKALALRNEMFLSGNPHSTSSSRSPSYSRATRSSSNKSVTRTTPRSSIRQEAGATKRAAQSSSRDMRGSSLPTPKKCSQASGRQVKSMMQPTAHSSSMRWSPQQVDSRSLQMSPEQGSKQRRDSTASCGDLHAQTARSSCVAQALSGDNRDGYRKKDLEEGPSSNNPGTCLLLKSATN
jgi:hypothetical protein